MNFSWARERIEYFRTHRFVRNFAILQVGNTLGNIIQAVIGIAFARILQPQLYGIYALAFGLAGLLSVFLGVGAQDAVTTILGGAYARQDKDQIRDALAFLVKITVITGVIAFIGALCAPLIAQRFYHNYHIGIYAGIVVCASIVSTTFYSFATIVLQIVGKIKQMTVLGLLDQVTRTLLALILVLFGFKVLGIALGHLAGSLIVFIASVIQWRRVKREFPIIPSIRSLIRHVRQVHLRTYLGFSFWIAVDRNLSNLYNILPIVLSGVFIVPGRVTFFKLAFGYFNLALSFLGPIGTLLNVEFPKMQVEDPDRLARNFVRISLYGLALSSGISISVALVSPIVFRLLYGTTYLGSLPYVYGLLGYGIIYGMGIGLGSILRALNKVMFSIKVHAISLIIGVPLGLVFISRWGLWGTVIIVTLWYSVAHILGFCYMLYTLKHRETRPTT